MTLEALRARRHPAPRPRLPRPAAGRDVLPRRGGVRPGGPLGRRGRARPGPGRQAWPALLRTARAPVALRRAPTCGSARRKTPLRSAASSCCGRRWSSTAWAGDCCRRPPAGDLAGPRRCHEGRRRHRRDRHAAGLPAGLRRLRAPHVVARGRRPEAARRHVDARRAARRGTCARCCAAWPRRRGARPATWLPGARPTSRRCRTSSAPGRAEEQDLLSADTRPDQAGPGVRRAARPLDRDAVTIGDGGDFVSYAGRYLDRFTPGMLARPRARTAAWAPAWATRWGPRVTHPDRQVCVLLGDGAAGFSLMDVESPGTPAACRW